MNDEYYEESVKEMGHEDPPSKDQGGWYSIRSRLGHDQSTTMPQSLTSYFNKMVVTKDGGDTSKVSRASSNSRVTKSRQSVFESGIHHASSTFNGS